MCRNMLIVLEIGNNGNIMGGWNIPAFTLCHMGEMRIARRIFALKTCLRNGFNLYGEFPMCNLNPVYDRKCTFVKVS